MIQRITRSTAAGSRTLPWLNIELALSSTSKTRRQRRRAEGGDDDELDHHRQKDLDRVEAHPCAHVEFEIGVVHSMQPPQHRHGMEEHMLEVDRKVERSRRRPRQGGAAIALNRPNPWALAIKAMPTAAVGKMMRKMMVSSTTTPRLPGQRRARPKAPRAPRRPHLPCRHGDKNKAGEGAETDQRLVLEEGGGNHGPIYDMKGKE